MSGGPKGATCLPVDWCFKRYYNCKGIKKRLMILNGYSESVFRWTENTMAQIKSTKGQTVIYKTLKIGQYEPPSKNRD